MDILYKLDSKWKIRVLKIITEWDRLFQISWLLDWKLVTHDKQITDKNVWKSNYQTAEEVCISTAQSLVNLKLREWYSYNKEDIEKSDTVAINAMLAKPYKDFKGSIDYNTCYVQRKFDWIRCLSVLDWEWGVELYSRWKVRITTAPHIEEQLSKYRGMPIILDGELYCHWLDFQTNISLVKKFRPWESDKHIKYHVYDTVDEQPFWIRNARAWFHSDIILSVETFRANSEETIDSYHAQFLSEWYEGTIIRYWKQSYETKRTSKLLKRKDFEDIIAKVIDVEPQEANPDMWTFILEWLEWKALWKTFKWVLKWTHEQRKEVLVNKDDYIWKPVEVRFFEYSQDGIPRFPVILWLRIDK